MRFFPAPATPAQTADFISRMNTMLDERGYCYFATDLLETKTLIGFIGLCYQDFISPFTPAVDIGWRLHPEYWNMGLATEGARRCLAFGFTALHIDEIICTAPAINVPSIQVMKKAGLQFRQTFIHPRLAPYPSLRECVCYSLTVAEYQMQSKDVLTIPGTKP